MWLPGPSATASCCALLSLGSFILSSCAIWFHPSCTMSTCFSRPMTSGRARPPRCEWNSGLPGMSWTKRRQGKVIVNIHWNYFIYYIDVVIFLLSWLSFLISGFSRVLRRKGDFLPFFKNQINLYDINVNYKPNNCYRWTGGVWRDRPWWHQRRGGECVLGLLSAAVRQVRSTHRFLSWTSLWWYLDLIGSFRMFSGRKWSVWTPRRQRESW